MKFSWQLTNSFLKIQEESFQKVLEKLILSGIEVENVENIEADKILDLSITSNRREINSALGLAREISTITNNILTIIPIKLYVNRQVRKNDNYLKYRRIHILQDNSYNTTPEWILKNLQINGTYHDNYLENIKEYIYLKWGVTFKIIGLEANRREDYNNKLINNIIHKHVKDNNNTDLKLLVFDTYKELDDSSYKSYDTNKFYENYYIDSINIIKELNQCVVGKYYESYENIFLKDKEILLDKITLNQWLGTYKSTKNKFLPTENTRKTLNNLKLFTQYIKNKKLFIIKIPTYRKHDINNPIDVIEEIGKISGFKNFYNTYEYTRHRGKSSREFIKVKTIRHILRQLGFNEVINCSIIHNALTIKKQITIYNPISEEQRNLRNNILISLIENHKHNIKYSNNNLFISEIGKIFKKKNYYEEESLAGLIYAPKYNRISWSYKSEEINISQVKGIMEIFFKQINSNVDMNIIGIDKINHNATDILKNNNRISVYSRTTKELIGVIGEINTKIKELHNIKNSKIYGFEVNLEKLIQTTNHKTHLDYHKKVYSNYPSIVRDISVRITGNKNVESIRQQIDSMKTELVESIEIFNEYNKTIKGKTTRFIGIRITYRSVNKTLDIKDVNKIETDLLKIKKNIL